MGSDRRAGGQPGLTWPWATGKLIPQQILPNQDLSLPPSPSQVGEGTSGPCGSPGGSPALPQAQGQSLDVAFGCRSSRCDVYPSLRPGGPGNTCTPTAVPGATSAWGSSPHVRVVRSPAPLKSWLKHHFKNSIPTATCPAPPLHGPPLPSLISVSSTLVPPLLRVSLLLATPCSLYCFQVPHPMHAPPLTLLHLVTP